MTRFYLGQKHHQHNFSSFAVSSSLCPIFNCGLNCPSGFVADEDGCLTCQCKPPGKLSSNMIRVRTAMHFIPCNMEIGAIHRLISVVVCPGNQVVGCCPPPCDGLICPTVCVDCCQCPPERPILLADGVTCVEDLCPITECPQGQVCNSQTQQCGKSIVVWKQQYMLVL